jgi:hypothetical protein
VLGTFSHGAEAGKVVAIAETSLLDVVGVNSIGVHGRRLENVSGANPFDLAHFRYVSIVVVLIDQARHLGREVGISPLFARSDDLLDLGPFCFHALVAA